MKFEKNQTLLLLGIAIFLILAIIVIAIFSLSSTPSTSEDTSFPTPTPIPYTRDTEGNFTFTPLQKTVITKTTAQEVESQQKIINKSLRGDITVYEVPSATPGETDEIRTKNGVVVFESVDLFNNKSGMPPKATVYTKEFGIPEKKLKSVTDLGKHISAYIYAEKGFTIFVNPNTNTVYRIHRFTPMTTTEYETQYAEFLEPAPEYPQEFFTP